MSTNHDFTPAQLAQIQRWLNRNDEAWLRATSKAIYFGDLTELRERLQILKPILCIDFDGVIHDYREGWKDGTIYGEPTPGFFEWAERAAEKFTLIVHSSRAASPEGSKEVLDWIIMKAADAGMKHVAHYFQVQATKPPAFLTIDDRAITFNGDWRDYDPADLRRFTPWMMEKRG